MKTLNQILSPYREVIDCSPSSDLKAFLRQWAKNYAHSQIDRFIERLRSQEKGSFDQVDSIGAMILGRINHAEQTMELEEPP